MYGTTAFTAFTAFDQAVSVEALTLGFFAAAPEPCRVVDTLPVAKSRATFSTSPVFEPCLDVPKPVLVGKLNALLAASLTLPRSALHHLGDAATS